MEWSQKRKTLYLLLFTAVFFALIAYPAYNFFKEKPTCFDLKQNGTETGVDCGGGCALMCAAEVRSLEVAWSSVFYVGGNRYDLGAYVKNVNKNAGIKKLRYTMRALDSAGQVLITRKGTTEIAPASNVLLVEANILLSSEPTTVEIVFEPEDLARWTKASVVPSTVVTKNQKLTNIDSRPRLDAILVNTDPIKSATELPIGVVVYNTSFEPVAVSYTYVDEVPKSSERGIFFTWPGQFLASGESFSSEILIVPKVVFSE